ncbi:TetR/AcrR family transcriptional regulator [Saccharopolyspora gloriosae]|uniref:AcrR family transcriptional regulator n=1 Tax=Saccharopolyspora gloriosae TaxID=455344 RepID=A0A840NTY9_9PSEU|nr:TetR/AcrR family transcriptional regulator [Saccharopolyspora gloriosae]MBB5072729.1 AcrR family transcriptional regulator [Saccharopolyspora gloriosae]
MTTAQRATGYADRVIAAAREVFTEQGFGAPISEVAQRAGVGVASIYRRWPSKTELAEQVRISCLRRIVAEARSAAAEESDPWRAFTRFLFRCLAEGSGVGTVLPPDEPGRSHSAEYAEIRREMTESVEALVRAAHEAGELRADFAAADVVLLFKHLNPALPIAEPRRADLRARYLALVVEGLRAGDRAELPGAAPDWAEVHAMRRPGTA